MQLYSRTLSKILRQLTESMNEKKQYIFYFTVFTFCWELKKMCTYFRWEIFNRNDLTECNNSSARDKHS